MSWTTSWILAGNFSRRTTRRQTRLQYVCPIESLTCCACSGNSTRDGQRVSCLRFSTAGVALRSGRATDTQTKHAMNAFLAQFESNSEAQMTDHGAQNADDANQKSDVGRQRSASNGVRI